MLFKKEGNIRLLLITLTEAFCHKPVSHSRGNFLFAPPAPEGVLKQTAVTLTHTVQKPNVGIC